MGNQRGGGAGRAIFAENDEMALGAIEALGDKAGKDVIVVGFDGVEDALKAIKEGTMYASIASSKPWPRSREAEEPVLPCNTRISPSPWIASDKALAACLPPPTLSEAM